jgi:hypothetical protein
MKVTNFKTYSLSKILKSIPKVQLSTLDTPLPPGLKKSEDNQRALPVSLLPYSSKLRDRLTKNQAKLKRESGAKRLPIRAEVLQALLVQPHKEATTTPSIRSIPLKRYSNQDAFLQQNVEKKTMRYLSNARDPFYQIRNVRHFNTVE